MIRLDAAFNGNLSGPRRFKTGNPVVRTVKALGKYQRELERLRAQRDQSA